MGLRGHLTNDHQVHSVREGLQQGHGMAVVNVDEAVTIGLDYFVSRLKKLRCRSVWLDSRHKDAIIVWPEGVSPSSYSS